MIMGAYTAKVGAGQDGDKYGRGHLDLSRKASSAT